MHRVGPSKSNQKLIIVLVSLSLFWAIPESRMFTGNTICLFKNFIGFECVGCGMMRALYLLSHVVVWGAVAFNRLVIIIAPLLIYVLVIQNLRQRPIH